MYDLTKGWHPEKPPHLLEKGELATAENLTYRENLIPEKRRGFSQIRGSHGVGGIKGLHRFKPAGGATRWVFAWQGQLMELWDNNTITQAGTGFGTVFNYSFATWKDRLFMANGADGLMMWDGGSLTNLTSTPPPPQEQPPGFPVTGCVIETYDGTLHSVKDSKFDFVALGVQTGDILRFTSGAENGHEYTLTKVETSLLYVAEALGCAAGDTFEIKTPLAELKGAPAGASYVCHFSDRLWLAATLLEPDKIFFSRLLDYQVWNDTETGIDNFIDVSVGDNQKITGIARTREHLTVFKERSLFYLMGYGPEDWKLERISDDLGCIAPGSLAQLDSMTIWLSDRGVYMDDGNNFMRIGEGVDTWINSLTYNQRVKAVAHIAGLHYYLHFPNTPDGPVILNWNGRFKVWTKWILDPSLSFSCFATKNIAGDTPDWLACSDSDCVFFQGDTGGSDNGNEITARVQPGIISGGTQTQYVLQRFLADLDLDPLDRAQVSIFKDEDPSSFVINSNQAILGVRLPRAQLYSKLKIEISISGSGTSSRVKGFVLESQLRRKIWGKR